MSHLPPVGWGDVATKVAALETRIVGLEGTMQAGFNGLRAEVQADLKQHLYWIIAAMVGLTAIFTAVLGVFTVLA